MLRDRVPYFSVSIMHRSAERKVKSMSRIVIMNEDGKVDKIATAKQRAVEIASRVAVAGKKCMGDTWKFLKENREDLVVLVPLGIAALQGVKKATQKTSRETERYRIDHTYYDPHTGRHWELKRRMTNYERLELEQRQNRGESTGPILYDMGLLR